MQALFASDHDIHGYQWIVSVLIRSGLNASCFASLRLGFGQSFSQRLPGSCSDFMAGESSSLFLERVRVRKKDRNPNDQRAQVAIWDIHRRNMMRRRRVHVTIRGRF